MMLTILTLLVIVCTCNLLIFNARKIVMERLITLIAASISMVGHLKLVSVYIWAVLAVKCFHFSEMFRSRV